MGIVEAKGAIKVIMKSEDLEEFKGILVKEAVFEYIEKEISEESYEEIFSQVSEEVEKAQAVIKFLGLDIEIYESTDNKIIIKTDKETKILEKDIKIKALDLVLQAVKLLECV